MNAVSSLAPAALIACACLLSLAVSGEARTIYNVGPDQALTEIGDVPWESLQAGDYVRIHWKPRPYREKWVISTQGTEDAPIIVEGITGPKGQRPAIEGHRAVTRQALNYAGEDRAVLRIGRSNDAPDRIPRWIEVRGLDIRGARPPFTFEDDRGQPGTYRKNAAAIHVEIGEHIRIIDCVLADSGNGLMANGKDLLVEGCSIFGNGIEGSMYEHNAYIFVENPLFQFNRFGPLREGCLGNNYKDRSAGLVFRYNRVEGGSRNLDLVDAGGGHAHLGELPQYRETHVYGNLLIKTEAHGNNQVLHYGGDSGNLEAYRQGTLHFFHNTVISTRPGNTTLVRLSSEAERFEGLNNLIYLSDPGAHLGLLAGSGQAALEENWLPRRYRPGFESGVEERVTSMAGNPTYESIDFLNPTTSNYRLKEIPIAEYALVPIPVAHRPAFQPPCLEGVVTPRGTVMLPGAFE